MRFRDDMLRPKVLVFMLPLLLPIGQPRISATGLNGADADPRIDTEPFAAPAMPLDVSAPTDAGRR